MQRTPSPYGPMMGQVIGAVLANDPSQLPVPPQLCRLANQTRRRALSSLSILQPGLSLSQRMRRSRRDYLRRRWEERQTLDEARDTDE